MVYTTLKQQIEHYLLRRGPAHVSKVIMGVRHNATGKQVNDAINASSLFVRFRYTYRSHNRNYYRSCVRLTKQKESDYRDEYSF